MIPESLQSKSRLCLPNLGEDHQEAQDFMLGTAQNFTHSSNVRRHYWTFAMRDNRTDILHICSRHTRALSFEGIYPFLITSYHFLAQKAPGTRGALSSPIISPSRLPPILDIRPPVLPDNSETF